MGTFKIGVNIGNQERERWTSIDAMVDTGAFLSSAPASVLRELGVAPVRRQGFRFADGSSKQMDVGEVRIRIDGREATTQVVFNNEDTQPLLGALALEELFLVVDPITKRLVPMDDIIWGR